MKCKSLNYNPLLEVDEFYGDIDTSIEINIVHSQQRVYFSFINGLNDWIGCFQGRFSDSYQTTALTDNSGEFALIVANGNTYLIQVKTRKLIYESRRTYKTKQANFVEPFGSMFNTTYFHNLDQFVGFSYYRAHGSDVPGSIENIITIDKRGNCRYYFGDGLLSAHTNLKNGMSDLSLKGLDLGRLEFSFKTGTFKTKKILLHKRAIDYEFDARLNWMGHELERLKGVLSKELNVQNHFKSIGERNQTHNTWWESALNERKENRLNKSRNNAQSTLQKTIEIIKSKISELDKRMRAENDRLNLRSNDTE